MSRNRTEQALDKMAENAKELGLDYAPAQCQYPKCSYPCPDLPDCRDAEQPAVPDAILHTDLNESLEYITGWNDCRAEMLRTRGNK